VNPRRAPQPGAQQAFGRVPCGCRPAHGPSDRELGNELMRPAKSLDCAQRILRGVLLRGWQAGVRLRQGFHLRQGYGGPAGGPVGGLVVAPRHPGSRARSAPVGLFSNYTPMPVT